MSDQGRRRPHIDTTESASPGLALNAPAELVSAIRLVLASPLYRGATIALFLAGLGQSAAAPQIAQFLTKDLHGSLTVAGLYYLTNLTAPVAGYLVGARSDRTGGRLGLFRVCAVLGFLGWAGIASATQLWMPFAVGAVILGFAGASASQLFAAIHDELSARPTAHDDAVVSIVRMALTAGWIVGPAVGTILAAQFGLRTMMLATGICFLAQVVPLGLQRTRTPWPAPVRTVPQDARPAAPLRTGLRTMRPLLIFTGLYVLVYAGEPIKYAYLPIYMNERLHFASGVQGAIIGIQPFVELVLMPFAVVAARRIGTMRLMVLAAAFGVGANICFATTATVPGLLAGQILMGGVWGVFAALGIIMAQRLLPSAVATASAIFISSAALSSALGGATGGLGVAAVGLPHVFLIPGAFGLIAVVGLALMDLTSRTADKGSGDG
ncbi:MFS transporter [Streptomyces yatensis]|uniref:Sugar efflux transporter n=1 Tax=Streptomyces yatensis TaxID=155177 RepID=A0ABN2IQ95_9ACTN|nr:MFS transporter [Streptomyces yatensis]